MDENIQDDQQVSNSDDALTNALKEAEDNLNGWKRAQADFENYKRRQEKQNQETLEFAKEVTIVKLLPTLDSLQQALLHLPQIENDEFIKWKNGVDGLIKQLDSALEAMGVKKINATGKKFDPNFHEAVREVAGEEDQMVVEELQVGYEINGKVIRPSQVVISKKV